MRQRRCQGIAYGLRLTTAALAEQDLDDDFLGQSPHRSDKLKRLTARRKELPALEHRGCGICYHRGKSLDTVMLKGREQQQPLAAPQGLLAGRQTFAEKRFDPGDPCALSVLVGLV